MKIVIDIPEELYIHFLSRYKYYDTNNMGLSKFDKVGVAIKNGTPLPKNHGRLIDENDLWFEDIDDISCVTQRNVENAPTIIEAEGEEEQ